MYDDIGESINSMEERKCKILILFLAAAAAVIAQRAYNSLFDG